jgi:hypothetical protein
VCIHYNRNLICTTFAFLIDDFPPTPIETNEVANEYHFQHWMTSTPIHAVPECDFNDDSWSLNSIDILSSDSDSNNQYLHDTCSMTRSDFLLALNDLITSERISDVGSRKLLSLFKQTLPPEAYIPSLYELKRQKVMPEIISQSKTHVSLSITPQLLPLIEENLDSIINYHTEMSSAEEILDIQQSKQYKKHCSCHSLNNEEIPISLILFTDGIPLFTSRNVSYWPILATIAELPVLKRIQLRNMLLLGLHRGNKPVWEEYLKPILVEITELHKTPFIIKEQTFRVRLLAFIMDAQAKASVLNLTQHNGFYGCPYCLTAGQHKNGRHLYRYEEQVPLRSNSHYINCAHNNISPVDNYGVKGSCTLTGIIDIPDAIPIDYMHQVLLGK